MNYLFTFVLILGAVAAFVFMLRKIRKSEVSISDATFWFLFALSLVVLAVFPQVAFFLSKALGMQAPSNFVFLYVIAVLVIKQFLMTVEIAKLRSRMTRLVQEQALSALPVEEGAAAVAGDETLFR